ncbi:hypothetical protein [Wenyingzhuangia sp. 2_MG-2023]|uniref:hypothetical protein n=1 Tax=Wenyingzhuangia sp. 2_MG-2023 TaxID=3062639 RepID=UPI0026E3144C|nr:hypothetical protein [Wenyingzhuangia sp. 2_MG-2023]MDO6736847.1 hypothetical protein [Wenyingzhuangia sp. 2_MG-2023]
MLKKLTLPLITFLVLTSCSPLIRSNFVKKYPALKPTDSIQVFEPEEHFSRDYSKDEFLGSIKVDDKGTTTNCGYDRMLQIIKDSARANGGNLIGIKQYYKPSFWGSSCHRFAADILKSDASPSDSLAIDYAKMVKNANLYRHKDTVKYPLLINFVVGPAFRTGDLDKSTEFSKAISEIIKTGTQFSFSSYYKYLKNSGIGFKYTHAYYGGQINNAFIEFNDGRPTQYGTLNIDSSVNYFAASLLSNYSFGNKKNELLIDVSLGYFTYEETVKLNAANISSNGGNIGFDMNIGYKRMLTQKFGLGLNLGLFGGNITKYRLNDGQNSETIELDKENAINLSNINLGVLLSYKL